MNMSVKALLSALLIGFGTTAFAFQVQIDYHFTNYTKDDWIATEGNGSQVIVKSGHSHLLTRTITVPYADPIKNYRYEHYFAQADQPSKSYCHNALRFSTYWNTFSYIKNIDNGTLGSDDINCDIRVGHSYTPNSHVTIIHGALPKSVRS